MSDSESSEFLSDSELDMFSDDDDLVFVEEERVRPKNENYLEDTVPQYNEKEFIEHFRTSRDVATEIAHNFEASDYFKIQSGGNGKLTALSQVLIFLWFVGHQTASFRDVADRFGISISSLFRVIRRLIYFVSNLSPQVIKWPDAEERREIELDFQMRQLSLIIGIIGGSHIKIDKPENDPDSYFFFKKYFSIQLQAVCDHQRRIRDLFVGYPGSVHDSRVFRTSPLAESLPEKCGQHYSIIGDTGYPCVRHLLTPFKDRGNLTRAQRNFNNRLSTNRYIVEHYFGDLKQKFRQLYHVKLRKIRDIVHFIRACCVLHNLTISDEFPYEAEVGNGVEANPVEAVHDDNNELIIDYDVDGVQFRNLYIMNNL